MWAQRGGCGMRWPSIKAQTATLALPKEACGQITPMHRFVARPLGRKLPQILAL